MALVVAPWRLVALSSSLLSCWSEVRILPGASHERPPRRRRYRRAHDARRGAQRAGLRRHRSRAWRRSVGQPAARLLPDRHFRLADARSRWAGALSPPARARDRPLFLLSLDYGDGREKTVPRGYGSGRRRFHHEADRHGRAARAPQGSGTHTGFAPTRAAARGAALDLRILQAHPRRLRKMGVHRAVCRRAVGGAIQSRLLPGLLREIRAAAD